MGFYGNITNTSNTTFQFDRIYPNRLSMDANTNNDGIFIGRYVLVEYERKAAYPVVYTKVVNNNLQFYSSPNCEDITRIKFGTGNDQIDQNDIVKSYPEGTNETTTDGGEWPIGTDDIKFYRCTGKDINNYAIFVEITNENDVFGQKSDYILNYAIDENHYYPQDENERRTYKGYDSTVWTKVSETSATGQLITKYVNIADLNSVVPTFDIAADAPTMTPITPHFDADSTNVYYKLHIQPQWGMRVAAADGDSDVETYWTRENYNPQTGLSTKEYWDKNQANWITYTNEEEIKKFDAAIYYNKAGFEEYTRTYIDNIDLDDNIINIEPTGESGNLYSNHNQSNSKSTAKDIQEIRINLPAIGNMMSDAWDIIHGKQRNDYRGDGENASLQGRLDSFDAFYDNQIPVKHTNDGKIIGSRINGAAQYDNSDTWENEEKPVEVLYDTTSPNFNRDDAWIKTEVYTTGLKDGDKGTANDQGGNSGISIHHTFHATESSTSSVDKNIRNGNIQKAATYKSDKIQSNNLLNIDNKKDFIELYTPYVDAKGHVVGKNIETVTLPYGYKTFTTEGLAPLDNEGKEIVEDLYTTINNQVDGNNTSSSRASASTSIADNTQDSIAIEPYNKWIQTQLSDDKLVIAHEIHAINTEKNSTDLNNLKDNKIQNKINIPDWDYDEAGHIKKKGEHTYTLPYGYKTFTDGTNNSVANSTQDTFTFVGDSWLKPTVSEDQITYTHIGPVVKDARNISDITPKFGDAFDIEDWVFDSKGHKTNLSTHAIKIPGLSLTNDTTGNVVTNIEYAYDTTNHSGSFTETKENIGILQLGTHTGTTITTNGLNILSSDTISGAFNKTQTHINNLNLNLTDSDLEWVTNVTQANGQIAIARKGTNNLKLNNYSALTSVSTIDLASQDTLNNAFGKLEYRIKEEEKNRKAAINALDVTDTIDNTKYVSGVSETDGKITVSRAGTDTLQLSNYSIATISSDIKNNDTINEAFGKLQKQIKNIYGSEEIAENFDSIKKISDWLKANDSNADAIIDSIAILDGDETVNGSVKKSIKDAIDTLGSAAFTESTNYATAAQGALADTAIQSDTEFAYKIQKDDGEGNIIEEELKTTIEIMAKEIANLKQVLKDNGLITE